MSDPVTVSSGQTYEKTQIIDWLKKKPGVDPVTGENLVIGKDGIKTNIVLKKLIENYILDFEPEQLNDNEDLKMLIYDWICKRGRVNLLKDPKLRSIISVYDKSC